MAFEGDDVCSRLSRYGLEHWIPAVSQLLECVSGAEPWLDDDRDQPAERIGASLERIRLLAEPVRDGALCELITQLLVWHVAVRREGVYWNPLETRFRDFIQDADPFSGWMHSQRSCTELEVYRWLIARVGPLTDGNGQ